jgi:Ca-activated chloride channel family protein
MTLAMTESTGTYTALSRETGEELQLAMQRLWLTGQVTPFGARLLVEHTFESAERRPVEVVYGFMLPQDAALRSFRVTGEDFEVNSDLQPVDKAVSAYEEGIDMGSLSVLARQYADGMMNLTVGNLKPGEPVRVILEILAGVERHDDGFRFRFPFTLAPAYHGQARVVSMPGAGEMELPPEEFGDLILPTWKKDSSNLHEVGFDVEVIGGQGLTTVSSPSHGIMASGEGSERRVGMAVEADVPNRDLVLEARAADSWQVAWASEGTISALLGSSRFGAPDEDSPRRVVFVIDRSGSMFGKPFEQAKKAVEVGIAALRPDDHFSIVAFDNEIEALSKGLLEANDRNRQVARDFLAGLHTCGGTELAMGVKAAAKALGKDGGDLLLLTDGQVFGTAKILKTARNARARIHALGIGSASQDRFLAQLGRETGGQSRFLTALERVDMALLDLFAGISPAVATDVEVRLEGKTLTTADVHVGRPLSVTGEGSGPELEIGWAEGGFALPVVEAPKRLGKTLRLLDGAAKITEVESRISGDPVGEDAGVLESLSREYGLASRVMALVAVVKREADKPGELPQTRVVPVGLPQDLQMDAYFDQGSGFIAGAPVMDSAVRGREVFSALVEQRVQGLDSPLDSSSEEDMPLPGDFLAERVAASLDLLERLIDHGSTRTKGAFRHHVRRLLDFLGEADLDEEQRNRLEELEARVERVFNLP